MTGEEVGLGGFSYNLLQRSDLALAFTDGGLAVLTGSMLTFPGLHRRLEDDALAPLTHLSTATCIDGGVPRILELDCRATSPASRPAPPSRCSSGRGTSA